MDDLDRICKSKKRRRRRESKTTSHSSLATSSCSGSKEGDLAADFQRQATLSPGSGGTREASQPSSGHSSRIMSPAPSNVSSVRSTIVGIHSRSLAKKLQENGSVCSVHSAGTPSPVPSPVRKKCRGGIASRQRRSERRAESQSSLPSGAAAAIDGDAEEAGGSTLVAPQKGIGNAGGTRGASPGKASVHFAETVDKTATSAGGGGAKANGSPANGNGHYGANGTSRSPKSKVNSGHGAKDSRPFDAYMTLNQVQRGLRKGELIEGVLRINPKRYEDAYISAPDVAMDIYICGRRERNGALDGDRVAVQLLPEREWKIFHDRVLDNLRELTEEEFQKLYANKDFSTRPHVAEMVHVARQGAFMNFNLFNLDDVGEPGSAKLIRDNNPSTSGFTPPTIGFWNNEDAGDSLTDRIKVRDKRVEDVVTGSDDDDYDVILEAEEEMDEELFHIVAQHSGFSPAAAKSKSGTEVRSKKEEKEVRVESCFDNGIYSDEYSREASPDLIGSVAVAPDELLGDICFVRSDSEKANSDDEMNALQRAEDEAFFNELDATCNPRESPVLVEVFEETVEVDDKSDGKTTNTSACFDNVVKDNSDDDYEEIDDDEEESVPAVDDSDVEINEPLFSLNDAIAAMSLKKQQQRKAVSGLVKVNSKKISPSKVGVKSSSCAKKLVERDRSFLSKKTRKKRSEKTDVGAGSFVDGNKVKKNDSSECSTGEAQVPKPVKKLKMKLKRWAELKAAGINSKKTDAPAVTKIFKSPNKLETNRKNTMAPAVKKIAESPVKVEVTNSPSKSFEAKTKKWRGRNKSASAVKSVNLDSGLNIYEILSMPKCEQYFQRKGRVVNILEERHPRKVAGYLKFAPETTEYYHLIPLDQRLPRLRIPANQGPEDFSKCRDQYKNTIFLAKMIGWSDDHLGDGVLLERIGETGNVKAETTAILLSCNVDIDPFPSGILKSLPKECRVSQNSTKDKSEIQFPVNEVEKRMDFRKDACVFTVDPETARDLDDAVHIKYIDDETLEVGVHIADVSYYVREGTQLDKVAAERSTSVYMVQEAVPMLPRELCEDHCSLNPGEPKLTVSCVWHVKPDGTFRKHAIGRSVIMSSCKLSYEHAQMLIEGKKVDHRGRELSMPEVHGEYTIEDIKLGLEKLHGLTKKLRQQRFESGALSLDQPKIGFQLDPEDSLPSAFHVYKRLDAHFLIEELMLLANMTIAEELLKKAGKKAVLRRHVAPCESRIAHLLRAVSAYGLQLDASSSKSLGDSLSSIKEINPVQHAAVVYLFTKPMKLAKYFVAESVPSGEFGHYALNVPCYTHFTSPIRRYPDILVHRLLCQILGQGPPVTTSAKALHCITEYCNTKKEAAKRCSNASSDLFFNLFLSKNSQYKMKAAVTMVTDQSFDVLLYEIGSTGRIYYDKIGMKKCHFSRHQGKSSVDLTWAAVDEGPDIPQSICIFDEVEVELTSTASNKYSTCLLPPEGAMRTKRAKKGNLLNSNGDS